LNDEIKIEGPEKKEPENNKTSTSKKIVWKDAGNVSEKETPSKKLTVGYLDVGVIALIVAFLAVTAYDKFFASKVVVVDLTGFVKEQTELLSQGKIGKEEITARLAQFQEFVKRQPQNLTVITKDIVLANGREISFSTGTAGKSPADSEKK